MSHLPFYDLLIIGAGPAGITASIYASRYNLKSIVIGQVVGGQVAEVGKLENYPGFLGISGLELAQKWLDHARQLGGVISSDIVEKISVTEGGFLAETLSGKQIVAKTVLLASGTEPRRLNIPGEKEFFGKGITYCFTCDAPFFKGKTVAVVGGGDSALTGALLLADLAKKVYLIHRREEFVAKEGFLREARQREKIEFVVPAEVAKALGGDRLEKIVLNTGKELSVDGLFVEIGSQPAKKLPKMLGIEVTQTGFVKVNPDQSVGVKGVYCAGDLTTNSNGVRQIVCAMSEGAIATQSIFKYLRGK